MVKWILKAVASLLMTGIIKFRWDTANAKEIIDTIQQAAADGVITGMELGFILDKLADQM